MREKTTDRAITQQKTAYLGAIMKSITAESLYKEHYSYILSFLMRKTGGDIAKSQDLAQETFIKVISNIEKFKSECSPKTWLCRIALSRLYNDHHASICGKRLPEGGFFDHHIFDDLGNGIVLDDVHSHDNGPVHELIEKQSIERVRIAIKRLSIDDSKLFTMAVEDDIPRVDIAKEFGIPEGTVKSRLNRIRRELRNYMDMA